MLMSNPLSGVIIAVSAVLFIAAVVLAFIYIVPESKKDKLNRFGKFLHDTVNFKYLVIEKILQALYIFATAFIFLCGFFLLFTVRTQFYGSSTWYGGYGILLMIFGPVTVRLFYELLMMAILLVKNVISINGKLKSQNSSEVSGDPFTAPDLSNFVRVPAPAAPATAPAEAPKVNKAAPAPDTGSSEQI